MSDLERLEIAREAFPFEDIDFEELIQRDIDYARVDDDLVGEYLLADKEGARFFPPLLISVVPIADDGRIADRYTAIETVEPAAGDIDGKLVRTWDRDKFKLALYTKKVATGHTIQ